MPNYYLYVYSPSDFVGGLPNEQGAAAAGSPTFSLTLVSGATPTLIEVSDGDNNFDEVANNQTLVDAVNIDGTSYAAGTSVVSAYDLINTSTGHQVTSVHFNLSGYSQGAVHGLISTVPMVAGQTYTFNVERTSHQQTNEYDEFVACFTTGTRLKVPGGRRAIEGLQVGDRVWTLDDGFQRVRWIGSQTVEASGALAPVCLKKGFLGLKRDILLSQQHRVMMGGPQAMLHLGVDQALSAAIHLCAGDSAVVQPGGTVTYWHVMFDQHQIVDAEGLLTESLLVNGMSLDGLGRDSRDEILQLFPDLARSELFQPARPLLRRHETAALLN